MAPPASSPESTFVGPQTCAKQEACSSGRSSRTRKSPITERLKACFCLLSVDGQEWALCYSPRGLMNTNQAGHRAQGISGRPLGSSHKHWSTRHKNQGTRPINKLPSRRYQHSRVQQRGSAKIAAMVQGLWIGLQLAFRCLLRSLLLRPQL